MNYQLNEAKMFADVTDGVAITINFETGLYYGMNGLATVIYSNLIAGTSVEDILVALRAIPGAPADIEDRLNAYIRQMLNFEILVESDAQNTPADIDAAKAIADNFEITVSDYSDAQALLLADPIHEVKEDTGWSPEKSALNEDAEDVKRREEKLQK